MPNKLDEFRDEILSLKGRGLSVRKIAEAIGQPASTVHHALRGWSNGEAESAKDSEIDSAVLLERLAAAELLVKQLHERLENVERRPAASPPSAEPEAQPPTHIHPVEPTPY